MGFKRARTVLAVLALLAVLAPSTLAQKGTGDEVGIARSGARPQVVRVSGGLLRIKDGPCSNTTGRSPAGIHLFLENEEGDEVNLHLGPSAAVSHMTEGLDEGDRVTARAFRTDKLGENEYVAVRFSTDDNEFVLRDETLRPVWAGRPLAAWSGAEDRIGARRTWEPAGRSRGALYQFRSGRRLRRRGSAYRGSRRGRGRCYRGRRRGGVRRGRGCCFGARRGRGSVGRGRAWSSRSGRGGGRGWRSRQGYRGRRSRRW